MKPPLPFLVVICLSAFGGCSTPWAPGRAPADPIRFTEISAAAGVDFKHHNGARGKKYMPEIVGSGVGFFDYDNDGWEDLILVNSSDWPGDPATPAVSRLYRNLANGKFQDVTARSGLGIRSYGMGVAIADYDNDGFQDVYLTALGPNRLFRNRMGEIGASDQKSPFFEDVTESAGVRGVPAPGHPLQWKWSSSAAWLDYDRDGRLDLLVLNYVKWTPKTDVWCGRPGGPKAYCPPGSYEGYPSTLYHNEGGRFRDVSDQMGIRGGGIVGKSFGIACADYNDDGWIDAAVANDTWANFLFINQGGKRFVERGVEAGVAYGDDGQAKAGMGIDTADWNNAGRFDILIGNFSGESLSLFRNEGDAFFTDASHDSGVAHASLHFLTFGLFFFDFDLDGWQDAFTANGHIDEFVRTYESMVTYKERPMLFHNERRGRFEEVAVASGISEAIVGRGAAWADFDHDGDPDIAAVSNGRPMRLYRNDAPRPRTWMRVRLEGKQSNRDGIGARVRLTAAGLTQTQTVKSGGSFLSESQRTLLFGLGNTHTVDRLDIQWPSGVRQTASGLSANSQYIAREGVEVKQDDRFQTGSET